MHVTASARVPTSLLSVIGIRDFAIAVGSVATYGEGKPICMLALNPGKADAIHLHGTPRLEASNCAVHANSTSSTALRTQGAASARAEEFCAVGGSSGGGFTPPPSSNCPAVPDPYVTVPVPASLSCNHFNVQYQKGNHTAQPGVYCGGIDIKAHASVTFEPGLYVIRDGALTMRAHSTTSGQNVTFYLYGDGAGLSILSHSTVDITAPASGDYAGLALVQHPKANPGHVSTIEGGGGVNIVGIVYMPSQTIDIGGAGGFGAASPFLGLVADSFVIRGNGTMAVQFDPDAVGFKDAMPRMPGIPRLLN